MAARLSLMRIFNSAGRTISAYSPNSRKYLAKPIRDRQRKVISTFIYLNVLSAAHALQMHAEENKRKEANEGLFYTNAIEWRFEFPEVLNNTGDFEGFDLLIGNPPYISAMDL